ncbi:MAG TPA: Gfo/Idh/MocA family oxidoreductase [Gemmatimonadaceae bacterium]|nr:Gfo/Idh/MocA family oxidoreductase [Gemmatimonadaceae bacterium]
MSLGIGIVGSGFNARFHIQSFIGVRGADIRGVWSPNAKHASATAEYARKSEVGDARAFGSIAEMVADPSIDAIWLCGPNHARIENIEEIVRTMRDGATLLGVACEKPLARNVAEAKKVAQLAASVELNTGYLENQLFAPDITRGKELIWSRGAALTGRPYLARAAEEHSGPHMPWFWQGTLQGGGVLNDMMCHSVEVVRHLLTKPGAPRNSIKPVRISAHIASLKWTRPVYSKRLSAAMGKAVNYQQSPAEDFARATIEYESSDGDRLIGEVTTSWSFVGAGLRLSAELLGPEYSMSWNTLDSGLKLFFSREVKGKAGEDLVEKQNAETGMMPVVADEAAAYGYTAENRHFVRAFTRGEKGMLTFEDGVEVMQILMAAYMSAQSGKTLAFPPRGLDSFVPDVAKGEWKP